jgi:hypothetical protein
MFYVSVILGGIESLLVFWIFEPKMLPLSEDEIATRLARMIRREVDDPLQVCDAAQNR